MKEKIIARLRSKYPGVNLSNARLDAIADKLSAKITDEKDIDAKLDEINDISPFSELAKLDDHIRGKEAKEKADKEKAEKEKADKEKKEKDAAAAKTDPPADVPEWAKGLIESNKQLTEKLTAFESEKIANTHQAKLKALFTEKKIPEAVYKHAITGRTFKDDAEAEAFGNAIVDDYGKHHQELVKQGLKENAKPDVSGKGGDNKETATKEEVADVMKNLMPV